MKIVILNLRQRNNRPIIGFDLTGKLTNFFNHHSNTLEVKLPTGTIYLSKYIYLNTGRIYQSPKDRNCFFLIFGYKRPCQKWALKRLLDYSKRNKVKTISPKLVAA